MTVQTYIAVLHDGPIPTAAGQPVVCPLQPDGTPKPEIDHNGEIYYMTEVENTAGVVDYHRTQPFTPSSPGVRFPR